MADAPEWAPRLTALALVLETCLWAAAVRRIHAVLSCLTFAILMSWFVIAAPGLVLFVPPVAINLALAVAFGSSLLPARTPVISTFALMEQGRLPLDLARYTRLMTWIWSVLFAAMAGVAAWLAVHGPIEVWSTFVNGVSYLLVASLFVGEYGYRRRRFSHYRHATLLELVRNVRSAGLSSPRRNER